MLQYVSKVCGILLGFFTFIKLIKGSVVEDFFRWIFLGGFLDFIYNNYAFLCPVLVVGVLLRWIRDWRWLAVIGVLVFLFVQFAL
jgi:hypothetical protein